MQVKSKRILVINSGSSSIKFRLYEMKREQLLVSGNLERIGETESNSIYQKHSSTGDIEEYKEVYPVANHSAGIKRIVTFLQSSSAVDLIKSLYAIGHRVVHGGETFKAPTLVNENVIEKIRDVIPLAPLHNPANLMGIEVMRRLYPLMPQVAVFDTAFFQTLPPYAYRYALPDNLYCHHHVRRYGFHGTSHQHVARETAKYLHQPLTSLRLITLHLGNGASATAINQGICIDTSMGMTPLEGLIMGTRCGDLDPALHFYLARTLNMDLNKIENLLNHESGMKGICGVKDMRKVHLLAKKGNELAGLAIEMYCYRIAKYIGAYSVALGGLDALAFTAGIGENDSVIRELVCKRLALLNIALDHQRNRSGTNETFCINKEDCKVKVLVVPANEELEIARQTLSVIN